MPATGATSSWVVFSVVISTTGSSAATRAPAGRSHRVRVPSPVNMPRLGITISCAIVVLPPDQLADDPGDVGRLRLIELLQGGGVGNRRLRRGERLDRRVQVVE